MRIIILISHNSLINPSICQVYLPCTLPSANNYMYTSHLQDATTVELAIKQFY